MDSSGFSTEETLISASAVPHRENCRWENECIYVRVSSGVGVLELIFVTLELCFLGSSKLAVGFTLTSPFTML